MLKVKNNLRKGFTTGACATAASVAAYRLLSNLPVEDEIKLLFPDSICRSITLHQSKLSGDTATAIVKKDAGDDIDITDGVHVGASVKRVPFEKIDKSKTIVLNGEQVTISLKRGAGVGFVNSDFLDVKRGLPAINPVPQNMILKNIELITNRDEVLEIEIFIQNGEEIAKRTLNSTLGVEKGLSILGTSGLVIPCSHDAYKDTISIITKGAAALGHGSVYLVTGGKTHKLLKKELALTDEIAIIRIGDFIYESIVIAEKFNIKKVIIGCMPGKLAKYSLGYKYTHAAAGRTDMTALADNFLENGLKKELALQMQKTRSVREFLSSLSLDEKSNVFSIWAKEAITYFKQWSSNIDFEILLFGFNSELLSRWKSN